MNATDLVSGFGGVGGGSGGYSSSASAASGPFHGGSLTYDGLLSSGGGSRGFVNNFAPGGNIKTNEEINPPVKGMNINKVFFWAAAVVVGLIAIKFIRK